MKTHCRNVIAAGFVLGALSTADAATWIPTSATIGVPAKLTFEFGGAPFSDGAYQDYLALTFVEWQQVGVPVYSMSFSLQYPGVRPPQVDLVAMRADFSSLFLTAYDGDGEPAIGQDMGLSGWVPLVANRENGYTASWIVGPSINGWDGFINQPISVSFTSAVDEPAAVGLFAVGLPLVFWRLGRQAAKSRPSRGTVADGAGDLDGKPGARAMA